MRKIITTLSVLCLPLLGVAQHTFEIAWKVGENKTAYVTEREKSYTDGELISDSVRTNETKIEILSENDTSYIIRTTEENIAMRKVVEMYQKLDETYKASQYRDLRLEFSVHKTTAKLELINYDEISNFLNDAFGQVKKLMDKKSPGSGEMMFNMIFGQLLGMFESKEVLEAYASSEFGFLLIPFGKTFVINDTIVEEGTESTPFAPSQEVTAYNKTVLTSYDTKTGIGHFNYQVDINTDQVIQMIKKMMEDMGRSFGADEETIAKKSAEMDDMHLEFENSMDVVFDANQSWIRSVTGVSNINSTDPVKGTTSRKVVETTVSIR